MTMTKEQFEKAVREKCPADLLTDQIENLDENYKTYKMISDDFCEGEGEIAFYTDSEGKGSMSVGKTVTITQFVPFS